MADGNGTSDARAEASGVGTAVTISAGRFPWVKEFEDRYGVDKAAWRALIDAVFPTAKTLDSVIMALSYCKARGLDPFKRPVHIVPMWNAAANDGKGAMVDTIWPGIGELRTTASRTGVFAGRDAAVFGPLITSTLGSAQIEHPEWCEVVVYRIVGGQRVAFHGPRVYWREAYAGKKHNDPTPNAMWTKRPHGQLEKCAEAGSLRLAFPEECGNEYTVDEMEGKTLWGVAAPSIIVGDYDQRPPDEIAEEPRGAFIMGDAWKIIADHYHKLFDECDSLDALEKHWASFQRKYWVGKRRCIARNSFDGMEHYVDNARIRFEGEPAIVARLEALIDGCADLSELESRWAEAHTEAMIARLPSARQAQLQALYEAAQERFADAVLAELNAARKAPSPTPRIESGATRAALLASLEEGK